MRWKGSGAAQVKKSALTKATSDADDRCLALWMTASQTSRPTTERPPPDRATASYPCRARACVHEVASYYLSYN